MAALLKLTRRTSHVTAFSHMSQYTRGNVPLVYSQEVRFAKENNKPIVALESTIITHGMPYPKNIETALEVEHIIRQRGATPATIAILGGQVTVGLTEEQVKYLGGAKGVVKASRRDLAAVMSEKLDGATTVAGTIVVAELAEIPIFVTGGIGGVHRNGEQTMDISADLTELGRSKTLVVCSGAKSILDIERTLEYLETQGVLVCSFGNTREFPAFYTIRSGHLAPYHAADAAHAARILHSARQLHLSSGIVIAVPVPQEHAMDEKIIEEAISRALAEANKRGIRGKEITPFLLSAVSEATAGASLDTNVALIKNNAKVGADIAVEFQKLKNVNNFGSSSASNIGVSGSKGNYSPNSRGFHTTCDKRAGNPGNVDGDVLVIGGANVDRMYRLTEGTVKLDGSTHACKMEQCGGGVARNMAEALWRMRGGRTKLLTALGQDGDGEFLTNIAPGLILNDCTVKDAKTSMYAAVFDAKGECLLGLGDMNIHDHITIDLVDRHVEYLKNAPLVVVDGNLPQTTMDHVLRLCQQHNKPVFFEPTDRRKAIKTIRGQYRLAYSSPNISELRAMAGLIKPNIVVDTRIHLDEIIHLSKIVSEYVNVLIVTIGSKGVVTAQRIHEHGKERIRVRLYPANIITNVENVSGAGDCFSSGFIYGTLLGLDEQQCISIGFEAAKHALLCKETVPSHFNFMSNIEQANFEAWVHDIN
ncbi:uncharacterized protein [Epargyreus clarus]|uniref:uncharacterized protein isoform X2 n=1 Tax=Epargyreus clarus TaxID=520877 RepID=UPI003C3043B9